MRTYRRSYSLKPSFDAKDALFEYAFQYRRGDIGCSIKYYPSHLMRLSGVLRVESDTRLGIPCYIKAIKLLGKADEVYRRIAYCIALFCGHMSLLHIRSLCGSAWYCSGE